MVNNPIWAAVNQKEIVELNFFEIDISEPLYILYLTNKTKKYI